MASTTFVPGTVVSSEWLNEVNDFVHGETVTGTSLRTAVDGASAQTALGGTTVGKALFTATSTASARALLGITDSVFSFSTFGYAIGVGDSYTAVTFDSPTINKGGAGMFTAPRAGFVRCRIGRFSYSVTSGSVTQVVLRFKQDALNQNPEFYVNGTGVWSGAEAMFPCEAGDVFGVSVLANGGGTASVTLAGCSFEMMD